MNLLISWGAAVCAFVAPAILTGLLKAIRDKEKTEGWTIGLMVCSVIIVTALLSL